MIDFTRAQLTNLIIHHVGNKGLGEELTLRSECIEFKDDFTRDIILRYFQSPFKTDIYHKFKNKSEFAFRDVKAISQKLFESRKDFIIHSQDLAKVLFDQTMHAKLKGGEFFVCYFKDVMVDGELCDCVGLFKTENRENFIKIFQDAEDVDIDNGININKLDKGCLIFNTDREAGYKISIVDTNNKVAECSFYWAEDFLNTKMKENAYYHTNNFIESCKAFAEEVLTEENKVSKQDQQMMLNKSLNYVAANTVLDVKAFEEEVLEQPELIKAFRDNRKEFLERLDLVANDNFDISTTAVKQNKKHMRTVIKLDKNFHLYIHGRHDLFEQGFDEEKKMKFYKMYYVNEE